MKRQHFLRTLLSSIVLMLFAATTWAENATMTAGTTGYASQTVNGKDAIKVGTSQKGGDMTITVPAGATTLEFYAAAWSGVSGLSLNITPAANVGTTSVALTADSGISGNSPFTLSGSESDYKFTISLSNITAETKIKLTSSIAKRFVVWGATYSTSGGGSTPEPETKKYNVTIDSNIANGTVTASATSAEAGAKVTLTATPSTGYEFGSWNVTNTSTSATIDVTNNQFTMPEANVNVSATFNQIQGGGGEPSGNKVTFSDLGYESWGKTASFSGSTYDELSQTVDGVVFDYTRGTGSTYANTNAIRFYKDNKLTFTAPTGYKITSIVWTGSSLKDDVTTDVETCTSTTSALSWTGNATSVTFTRPSNATSYATLSSVVVTIAEAGGSTDPVTVTAPKFDVAAGKYTEAKTVKVSNYDSNNLYVYTLDGSAPEVFGREIKKGIQYNHSTGVAISESATLKMLAVDDDGNASNVTSATYTINIPVVYASLNALVADDITSGTTVTVSFENVPIKEFFTTTSKDGVEYRNGVYFDIQKGGKDIEIYFKNVPETWVEGGTLSGTMTCPWTLYNGTWELAPSTGWAWTNLTYTAPATDHVESVTLSGTPTKLTYAFGEKFDLSGLTVTAHHSIAGDVDITNSKDVQFIVQSATGNYTDEDGFTAYGTQEMYVYAYLTGTDFWDAKSIYVTVTKKKPVINIAEISLGKGEELTITATTDPEGLPLTYSIVSGENDVITLNGDKLTGVAAGDATIKASFAGNEEYDKVDKPIDVTVYNGKLAKKYGFTATSGDFDNTSDITFEAFQGESATAPAANVSGNGCLRLYQNGGYVTVSGAPGVTIKEAYLYLGDTYDKTIIADTEDDEELDPSLGLEVSKYQGYQLYHLNCNKVTFYCLGTDKNTRLDIAKIEVVYEKADVKLDAITLSGDYKTDYIVGQEFSNEGMVVTASYTGTSETKVVTSEATFSGYDLSNTGAQTVTVSYTEGDITKTATYTINVAMEEVESIAVTTDEGFKNRYTVGEEFSTEGIKLSVTYNSGRTMDLATEAATISGYDMSTPGKQTVTVTYADKTATFDILLLSANTVFYESFDTNDGTGGNDDKWSGSIASNDIKSDNGWTFANVAGAKQCAKFGAGSKLGSAQTPALGCKGAVKITFKAAAWNGSSEATTLNIQATDGVTLSAESVTLTKGAWNEYTIYAYGLNTDSKITFAAEQTSNNRFFLDEVFISRVSVADLINVITNLKHTVEGEEGSVEEGIYTIDNVNEMRDAILEKATTTDPEE